MFTSQVLRAATLAAALLVNPVYLFAQTTNGTILGDVTDSSNAVVTNASVTVRNSATGVERTVETSETGAYRVFPLNPGTYDVTISKPGFRSRAAKGVVLEVAATVKVDLQLEVGNVTESIQISAVAPVLQTQEATTGGVITTKELEKLPVNGRNYTRLILLMPGSSNVGQSQTRGGISGTSLYSVNGQRRQDNNYTVDGVDNNFMMMNSPGGSPPMDSIQEFKIANNTSAEYGRSAGSNVNVVIKSGSRDLHGSVYEYFRNDKLDANDFFANRSGSGKVPFRQNQYGVSAGGPIVIPKLYNGREKTFWFANWEGYRRRRGTNAISTTPIVAQRNGDFSQSGRTIYDPFTSRLNPDGTGTILRDPFPGNIIPPNRISPAIRYFVDTMMPLPNRAGLNNNLLNTESLSNDRDLWNLRADHVFNPKNTVFFRYSSQNVGQLSPNANVNLYAQERFDVRNMAASWNHIFGATTVLEVKFGYNNPVNPNATFNRKVSRAEFLQKAGITMYQKDVLTDPIPALNAVGEFSVGPGGDVTEDHIWQGISSLATQVGRHAIKFGVNYSRRHFFTNTSNPMNGNADFDRRLTSLYSDSNSGHSFATMLLGTPTEIRRGLGDTTTEGRINAPHLFVQDDWRVNSRLTLNLGLRYEYNNSPYDTTDRLGNLWIRRDPQTGKYSGTLLWATTNPEIDPDTGLRNQPAKTGGFGRSLMQNNYRNFAPRVGFAYQIDSKTVVRSAYGIFYNSTFVQELQDLRKFWPFTVQQVFTANRDSGAPPDLLITDPGPSFNNTANIGGWPQNPENRTPYSQQWNLTVQRQLLDDIALDVAYVGSSNKRQVGYTAINTAVTPGPGDIQPRRLLPTFGDLDGGSNSFSSNYHGLQTRLIKRFSRGLLFNINYTWARAMDDQSSLAESKAQDAFNRRADYSRSSFDLRHVFNISYVYELPFGRTKRFGNNLPRPVDFVLGGWAMEGIGRFQTGAPYNVLSGQDRANVGRSYQRPDVLRNPNLGPKTVEQWFDTKAFVLPKIFTYGNAGAFLVEGDGQRSFDLSLAKMVRFRERQQVEFRGEFYNLTNTTSLGGPNTSFSSSAFGQITSALPARQIQLALRYQF